MSASAQPTFAGTRCLPIEDYFHRIPLVPWICPPLHPELLRLLENIGQEAVLAPGAQIYREGEPVSRFAVVKKGLVARKLGTYGAKSDNQIGLAGPGNIATGNLNIFSHRPAVGAYEAILPTSIVWCEHREFFEIARRNPDLFMLLATQCELSMLSDRLAFACLTLLNSEQAMKVVLLSWTSHFGHLEGDEVIAPRVLTRSIIRSVLGCSMGGGRPPGGRVEAKRRAPRRGRHRALQARHPAGGQRDPLRSGGEGERIAETARRETILAALMIVPCGESAGEERGEDLR